MGHSFQFPLETPHLISILLLQDLSFTQIIISGRCQFLSVLTFYLKVFSNDNGLIKYNYYYS